MMQSGISTQPNFPSVSLNMLDATSSSRTAFCDVWTKDNWQVIKDGSTPSDSSKSRPAVAEGEYQLAAQFLSNRSR